MPEFGNSVTQRQTLSVSLRGKLSADYIKLQSNDADAATRWIRQLVRDATGGHPQLLAIMCNDDARRGPYIKIGLKSEVGKYADW